MQFPQITLTGTPYEKGFTHGSLCKEQVLASIRHYRIAFEDMKGLSWEDALKLAQEFLPVFTGKYAKYLEEMRGIADGAGVSFDEILALNLRTEISYSSLSDVWKAGDHGCTAFSALAPATRDGLTLAGQTWDFALEQRDASLIARIPAEDGNPSILLMLEGGIVGGKGVNAAGISLTLNALSSTQHAIGVPLHIRMRRILECTTLNDAYKEATVTPIPMPANLIITHKDGQSLSLELDPSGVDVILPEDGIIVHTNHFYGPRMVLNHEHVPSGSTYMRLQRMRQLMKAGAGDLTSADLESFCKDHVGYPTSICVHPDPKLPGGAQRGATNYAFVADLTHGVVRFVAGNPCEGEFAELPVCE